MRVIARAMLFFSVALLAHGCSGIPLVILMNKSGVDVRIETQARMYHCPMDGTVEMVDGTFPKGIYITFGEERRFYESPYPPSRYFRRGMFRGELLLKVMPDSLVYVLEGNATESSTAKPATQPTGYPLKPAG